MIEGLKVCIPTVELRELCIASAEFHHERAATYDAQINNLKAAQVEGMKYTNGNPIESLTERKDEHEAGEMEMRFIAKYLKDGEEYLLSRDEMLSLGVVGGQGGRRRRW